MLVFAIRILDQQFSPWRRELIQPWFPISCKYQKDIDLHSCHRCAPTCSCSSSSSACESHRHTCYKMHYLITLIPESAHCHWLSAHWTDHVWVWVFSRLCGFDRSRNACTFRWCRDICCFSWRGGRQVRFQSLFLPQSLKFLRRFHHLNTNIDTNYNSLGKWTKSSHSKTEIF